MTDPDHPLPSAGGSYIRDPATGALTPVPPDPEPVPEPEAPAAPAARTPRKSPPKEG